jgi:hypothetical protein
MDRIRQVIDCQQLLSIGTIPASLRTELRSFIRNPEGIKDDSQ